MDQIIEKRDLQNICKAVVWDHSEIPDTIRRVLDKNMWTELPQSIIDKAGQIANIELEEFGKMYGLNSREVQQHFKNPQSEIVLLYDTSNPSTIIGYTLSMPAEQAYSWYYDYNNRACGPHTSYIVSTVIKQEYRNKGLVGTMMTVLEQELKRNGYTHLERDAVVKGNYADKIRKSYKDRIEESVEEDSPLGKQVFFRIRL